MMDIYIFLVAAISWVMFSVGMGQLFESLKDYDDGRTFLAIAMFLAGIFLRLVILADQGA